MMSSLQLFFLFFCYFLIAIWAPRVLRCGEGEISLTMMLGRNVTCLHSSDVTERFQAPVSLKQKSRAPSGCAVEGRKVILQLFCRCIVMENIRASDFFFS